MITPEEFEKKGVLPGKEPTPIYVLEKTKMAMTTKEIYEELKKTFPEDTVTSASVKQRLIRAEKKGLVKRKKIKGLSHWLKVSKE